MIQAIFREMVKYGWLPDENHCLQARYYACYRIQYFFFLPKIRPIEITTRKIP